MQLALLCVRTTVRWHRQGDRLVVERPSHLSVLCYILTMNHIPLHEDLRSEIGIV